MESRTLGDEIHISCPAEVSTIRPTTRDVLFYLITGNPGLIEYYRTFLTSLSQNFEDDKSHTRYHFVGRSLGGFELNGLTNEESLPLSLQEQITHVEKSIQDCVTSLIATSGDTPGANDGRSKGALPVILIGHSVGTYIILELIARRQKQQRSPATPSNYRLVSGINLFPTIIDIAKSPTGQKASPFATSPYLAPTLHFLSRTLTTFAPTWALQSLVQRLTGHNVSAAAVTAAFLASRYGVSQALHMARFELLEMTEDKWDDQVWGGDLLSTAQAPSQPDIDRPKLYFYWGNDDHWIDNATRDSVIAKRARNGEGPASSAGPWMEVDTRGTGHDFCVGKFTG